MTISANEPSAVISGTTTSARAAYPLFGKSYVRVFNDGTTTAYIRSGDSSVVAAAGTGQFIGGGKTAIFQHSQLDTHIAAIMVSGTANIYIAATDANEITGF